MKLDETTSVKVNSTKKQLAKDKGLKLQDLLDKALDIALGFDTNNYDTNTILVDIEETTKKINHLEETKKLELDRVTKDYDNRINELKLKLEFLNNEYDNLDELKLETIKKERQKEDYLEVKGLYIKYNGKYKDNEDLSEAIAEYINLYELDTKEVLDSLRADYLEWDKERFKK